MKALHDTLALETKLSEKFSSIYESTLEQAQEIDEEAGIRDLESLGYNDIEELLDENPAGNFFKLNVSNGAQIVGSDWPEGWTENRVSLSGLMDRAEESGNELGLYSKSYGTDTMDYEVRDTMEKFDIHTIPAVGLTEEPLPEGPAYGETGELSNFDPDKTYESKVLPMNYNTMDVPDRFSETFGAIEELEGSAGPGYTGTVATIKSVALDNLREELERRGIDYDEAHFIETEGGGDYVVKGRYPEDITEANTQ